MIGWHEQLFWPNGRGTACEQECVSHFINWKTGKRNLFPPEHKPSTKGECMFFFQILIFIYQLNIKMKQA